MNPKQFKKIVWKYYRDHGRHDLVWRKTKDAYKILVSEVMLQQTQVARVKTKYAEFLKQFPTVKALAKAPTKDVLTLWQGLGYNRRALYLKRAAEIAQSDFGGTFPSDRTRLESLPGIGQSTSGAILTFAFGKPVIFIETNIRSVYIHHYADLRGTNADSRRKNIHDDDLLPVIEKTLDRKNPREWYYALMDYGVYLKENHPNPSRKSIGYKKQSAFKGSRRELRAQILRLILKKPLTEKEIIKTFPKTKYNISEILQKLTTEGFITLSNKKYSAK